MKRFEDLVWELVEQRRHSAPHALHTARRVGALFLDENHRPMVTRALEDPFFPLTLFSRHYTTEDPAPEETRRTARDLFLWSSMFLRIRADLPRVVGNQRATCIDLRGDALQPLPTGQWCSFCGECCQLPGTVPDPPQGIVYPGYWYAYIAGDGPVLQKFCPFLFELPPQRRFFCAIHNVKPLTCLRYGRADCLQGHPGKALGVRTIPQASAQKG